LTYSKFQFKDLSRTFKYVQATYLFQTLSRASNYFFQNSSIFYEFLKHAMNNVYAECALAKANSAKSRQQQFSISRKIIKTLITDNTSSPSASRVGTRAARSCDGHLGNVVL